MSGDEEIIFTTLIRPASMRSSYWQYFGFPAYEDGHIITRKKIICTLCNKPFAYNKNTSNLKAHLLSKHADFARKMTEELGPSSEKKIRYKYEPSAVGQPIQIKSFTKRNSISIAADSDYIIEQLTDSEIYDHQDQEIMETEQKLVSIDYIQNAEDTEMSEDEAGIEESPNNIEVYVVNDTTSRKYDENFDVEYIDNDKISEAITNMVVEDLLPVNLVEGSGFGKMLLCINKNIKVPKMNTVT